MTVNPSVEHERLVGWLDSIAILSGHSRRLRGLPRGGRPDVVRLGPASLFLGEAKVSETSGNVECLRRMSGYLDATDGLGRRLVAIATSSPAAARGWVELLGYLQPTSHPNVTYLSEAMSVAWVSSSC